MTWALAAQGWVNIGTAEKGIIRLPRSVLALLNPYILAGPQVNDILSNDGPLMHVRWEEDDEMEENDDDEFSMTPFALSDSGDEKTESKGKALDDVESQLQKVSVWRSGTEMGASLGASNSVDASSNESSAIISPPTKHDVAQRSKWAKLSFC
jgi:hypothetical protein